MWEEHQGEDSNKNVKRTAEKNRKKLNRGKENQLNEKLILVGINVTRVAVPVTKL